MLNKGFFYFQNGSKFGMNVVQEMGLLDHVKNGFVLPQPNVMVRDCHGLKRDVFRVLEKGVWPPDVVQPFDGKQPVFGCHVVWQP